MNTDYDGFQGKKENAYQETENLYSEAHNPLQSFDRDTIKSPSFKSSDHGADNVNTYHQRSSYQGMQQAAADPDESNNANRYSTHPNTAFVNTSFKGDSKEESKVYFGANSRSNVDIKSYDNMNNEVTGGSPSEVGEESSQLTDAETLKEALSQGHHDFIAGTIGGMAGIAAGQPFDTVKTRIQTSPQYPPNLFKSAAMIIRQEGFSALYKGMTSPLLGVGLINAIVFGVYGNYLKVAQSNNGWEDESSIPYHAIFTGGCLGGLMNCAIVTPIEFVKIQMQVDAQEEGTHSKYKSVRHCVRTNFRGGGITSLYKGMIPTMWREVPSYGLYFVTFEFLRRWWGDNQISIFMAGGMGGVIAWIASYPFDVVKSRMQAQPPKPEPGWDRYKNMTQCARDIYKAEGGQVFWRGLSACLIRSFPMNAITFLVVHQCYEYLEKLDI